MIGGTGGHSVTYFTKMLSEVIYLSIEPWTRYGGVYTVDVSTDEVEDDSTAVCRTLLVPLLSVTDRHP